VVRSRKTLRADIAAGPEPPRDCVRCPRLVEFRVKSRTDEPAWFNSPVPSFGCEASSLLIVGLAPGLKGANRTGRPFTGDYAGDLLYATLIGLGLATGTYAARADDGLALNGVMISNAVRCVPPGNKPTPAEIGACRPFLSARMAALPRLRAILALGRIAHDSVLQCFGARKAAFAFAHGARHGLRPGLTLFDSYHCSRLNTSTGVLTPAMFRAVLADIKIHLAASRS
jgi:uracil-DNA glycosylase